MHRRALVVNAEIEVENLFPVRREIDEMGLLAEVFLSDLQLIHRWCLPEAREQWRDRLAHLEVDGTMLDLYHDVVVELGIKAFEVLDSGVGAVGIPVTFVEVLMVVDEGTDEDSATMGLKGSSKLQKSD